MTTKTHSVPRPFVERRIHSLLGLFIVLFLTEHLITNSQAALFLGDDGKGFIEMVNWIHSLPYLQVIEVTLIGLPILYHGVKGIGYAINGRPNSYPTNGSTPSMTRGRSIAYTLQRMSSWILLVGLLLHVGTFRFYKYPYEVKMGEKAAYFVRLSMDNGLYTLSDRLGVTLYGKQQIQAAKGETEAVKQVIPMYGTSAVFSEKVAKEWSSKQQELYRERYTQGLTFRSVKAGEVMAESDSFGTIILLNVRDSFKSWWVASLYTIFVLAAVFHAYNGLWTFLITWGIVLRIPVQKTAVKLCYGFMALMGALGLCAIWGTFYLNLRY